jgi:hypothetical protein
MNNKPFDLFAEILNEPTEETPSVEGRAIAAGVANAKLRRNLDLALTRQGEILSQTITEAMGPKDKRLVADVATATVKAANSVDRTVLAARQEETLRLVLQRMREEQARLASEEVVARGKTIEGN